MKYEVSAADFYTAFRNEAGWHQVEAAMGQLINRYGIRNKRVLSLGPGSATEEYWFHQAGCPLTLIDIDEGGTLQSRLIDMWPQKGLVYHVEDAGAVPPTPTDVLYVSSLAPEEIRRGEILKQYGRWPLGVRPFSSLIERYLPHLTAGGLFILQSYAYSVDLVAHHQFIPLMRHQLHDFGMHVLEVYRFKDAPGVSLTVAFKGSKLHTALYMALLQTRPPLTTFHGRAALADCGIVKEFDLWREQATIHRLIPARA